MPDKVMPRYPVYIPSKGRADVCLTPLFLIKDGVPFSLVVEPQEYEPYAARFGAARVLTLPSGYRGLIAARNWIKGHATAAGYYRHWQLDDNIEYVRRRWRGKRFPCASGVAFAAVEDFVDRYENVALAGMNYQMFVRDDQKMPPFYVNIRVYSCSLVLNSLPNVWRARYNDDTDMCLQVLADGWCTVLFNAFMVDKKWTMTFKGGNTDDLYRGDGRLKMARTLECLWPGVVDTRRRFRRPQHVVRDQWRKFDTPLRLKPGVTLDGLGVNEYGMTLTEVRPVKSETLRGLIRGAVKESPEPPPEE